MGYDTQTEFETLILDADTPLFRAAKSVEENYVIVRNKETGEEEEFKTLTTFYGHYSKKEGGELAYRNLRDGTNLTSEDYEYQHMARLKPEIERGTHLEAALDHFHKFIGTLHSAGYTEGLEIAIGGSKCHRHKLAKVLKYKGERGEKPLLFSEVREGVVDAYPDSVVVCDGLEADDYLSIKGFENYKGFKKTGVWKYLLCYCDKDILMSVSPRLDFTKMDKGIYFQTPLEGARCFASQLLSGDKSTDNILGLPNFTEETQKEFGLGKTRGIGKTTSLKVLKDCDVKEMFTRVCKSYKSYYGDEDVFTSWDGEELTYTWLDHLQETAHLIWMLTHKDALIDMKVFLKQIGVDYGNLT